MPCCFSAVLYDFSEVPYDADAYDLEVHADEVDNAIVDHDDVDNNDVCDDVIDCDDVDDEDGDHGDVLHGKSNIRGALLAALRQCFSNAITSCKACHWTTPSLPSSNSQVFGLLRPNPITRGAS
jgi:hypothetical protein